MGSRLDQAEELRPLHPRVDQERAAGKKIWQEFGEIGNERATFDLSVRVEGAVMFTAIQSAHKREPAACREKPADHGLSKVFFTRPRKTGSGSRHFYGQVLRPTRAAS